MASELVEKLIDPMNHHSTWTGVSGASTLFAVQGAISAEYVTLWLGIATAVLSTFASWYIGLKNKLASEARLQRIEDAKTGLELKRIELETERLSLEAAKSKS